MLPLLTKCPHRLVRIASELHLANPLNVCCYTLSDKLLVYYLYSIHTIDSRVFVCAVFNKLIIKVIHIYIYSDRHILLCSQTQFVRHSKSNRLCAHSDKTRDPKHTALRFLDFEVRQHSNIQLHSLTTVCANKVFNK